VVGVGMVAQVFAPETKGVLWVMKGTSQIDMMMQVSQA